MFIFRLCFKHYKTKSIFACLKVLTESIDMAFRNLDVVLKDNICLALGIVKKLPACFFEQVIDLDSGFGFFAHRFPWQVLCPLSKASIPQKPEVAPISPKMAVICKATSIMNMTPKSCFGIAELACKFVTASFRPHPAYRSAHLHCAE